MYRTCIGHAAAHVFDCECRWLLGNEWQQVCVAHAAAHDCLLVTLAAGQRVAAGVCGACSSTCTLPWLAAGW